MNQVFDWHVEVKKVGQPGVIDGVECEAGAQRNFGLVGARGVR